MKIGYACLTVGVNDIRKYRTCTVNKYSDELIEEIVEHNLNVLEDVLKYNVKNGIKMFRISSDIIPLASHLVNTFDWKVVFSDKLLEIGSYIKENDLRVSMHPGQYTVLNSTNDDVVARAILDLNYHTSFLDSLNLNTTHKVVLHIGGVYDNKELAIERFENNYLRLNERIRARLIIENDDKLYNIDDVLLISKHLNIPVVFDNLHHKLNCSSVLSEIDIIKKCAKTWKGEDGVVKIHYSNQNPSKRAGAHSNFIYIEEFLQFYNSMDNTDLDIMLEVKDKNLSAIKCINCITSQDKSVYEKEWAKYKYVILERNHNAYRELREYLKSTAFDSKQFYLLIEKALESENSAGGYRNGFDHVWGYFKKVCTDNEREMYKKKLGAFNEGNLSAKSMKTFLYKLSSKYNSKYLLESYYFSF